MGNIKQNVPVNYDDESLATLFSKIWKKSKSKNINLEITYSKFKDILIQIWNFLQM